METKTDNSKVIEQLQEEIVSLKEEIENYRLTLGDGANLICESLGVEPEFYDRDQSDYACYSDMFEDVGRVILLSGIKWDDDEGEFRVSHLRQQAADQENENG